MRFTIHSVMDQVRTDLETNLNGVLEAESLAPLLYDCTSPRVETDRMKMGVYLSSPDGEVFSADGRMQTIDITLDCILDDDISHSNWSEEYLSIVISYLSKKKYGISSLPFSAIAVRSDLDSPVNGFAVAMRITLYDNDMDI